MAHEKEEDDEEGLPELPPIRTDFTKPQLQSPIPEIDEDEEKNTLPSFPDSPTEKGFSQSAIKEAVKDKHDKEDNDEYDNHKIKTIEMEEWTPSKTEKKETKKKRIPKLPKLTEKLGVNDPVALELPAEKRKEVFVKIDKFKSAKKSMDSIVSSINEIEELMKKIRETKMREEQEFNNWEKEVESVKSRIQNVRENIFEQLE